MSLNRHPLAGRKQSPEHVQKRAESIRQRMAEDPSYRQKLSDAARQPERLASVVALGHANRGRVQSEEQKRAHRERMTGRTATPEARARMSESQRERMAQMSPEAKEKMFERRQRASYKPSSLEVAVQQLLDGEGIAFVIHPWVRVQDSTGKRVLRPDLLLPAHNLIIEVNGCYWHGCEPCHGDRGRVDRRPEDDLRSMLFEEQGYRVFFLWEHDVKTTGIDTLLQELDEK